MSDIKVPWFGARKVALELAEEVKRLRQQMERLGGMSVLELEERKEILNLEMAELKIAIAAQKNESEEKRKLICDQVKAAQRLLVSTEEAALLQEAGVYA